MPKPKTKPTAKATLPKSKIKSVLPIKKRKKFSKKLTPIAPSKKLEIDRLPRWKLNPEYEKFPLYDTPHNYIRVSSESECPPGVYCWIVFKNDQVKFVLKELQYEKIGDVKAGNMKISKLTGKGNVINTYNGIERKSYYF